MQSSTERLKATIAAMTRTPPSEWVVSRMWIDGWYDGPEAGLCEFSSPTFLCYFEVIALAVPLLRNRLYRINVVDPSELRDAMAAEGISPLVWMEWKSDTDAEQHPNLTRLVERLERTSQPTNITIESEAFPAVTAIWAMSRVLLDFR